MCDHVSKFPISFRNIVKKYYLEKIPLHLLFGMTISAKMVDDRFQTLLTLNLLMGVYVGYLAPIKRFERVMVIGQAGSRKNLFSMHVDCR